MNKAIIGACIVTLIMLIPNIIMAETKFEDLKGYEWATPAITSLSSNGVINGTSNKTYSPGRTITRADFIVILVKGLKLNSNSTDNFNDIYIGAYYAKEVGIAKTLKIVDGTGKNKFNPGAPITEQDMIVTVYRALKAKEIQWNSIEDKGSKFTDISQVSKYAAEGVKVLEAHGILDWVGDKVEPKKNANRAEAAMIVYNAIEKLDIKQ